MMMFQKRQQEALEQQQKLEQEQREQQEQLKQHKIAGLKNKKKSEESEWLRYPQIPQPSYFPNP